MTIVAGYVPRWVKLLAFTVIAAFPAQGFAQGTIAGTVRDSSGAVLPKVIVEATSSALIEKVRSTVTDGAGRYRLEELRPGTYQVTFRLNGWRPHLEDGIELTGSLTATVNAELSVGPITELISVTANTPAVDVMDASREMTLTSDILKSTPTVRSYNSLIVLVPGVITNTNDTMTGTVAIQFPLHGGRSSEGRLLLDGLNVGSPPNGNSATSYDIDVANAQEVTFSASAVTGESETAGLIMNVVPRSGGNTRRGSLFGSGTTGGWQSDNLTPELTAQGVTAAAPLTDVFDVSGTFGGPIARDRAWYFVNAHTGGSRREVPNVYYNVNAGDGASWLYAPDLNRHEYSDRTYENASGRVTWQLAARHKVSGFWDAQIVCRSCSGSTPGLQEPQRVSPEAVGTMKRPLNVTQATWSSPMTNRLLLEAGYGGTYFRVGNPERSPNPTRELIRIAEQCANGCAANGDIPGLVYRSQDFADAHTGSYLLKGSASFVTGSHSVKVGYQRTLMTDDRTWMTNTQNLTYRLNNGVPNQLTQSISPWVNNSRAAWEAVFVQEQWTRDRLTLQGALRFDRAWSWFPEQQEGPSTFLPTPIVIPETRGVDSYKDIAPRMGLAYDLFGTGKTALKVSLSRYLEGASTSGNYANTNPTLRMPTTTQAFGPAGVTRAWTDANRNFTPDCDLMNPSAQDLRASGGDLCGVMSNTNFGKDILANNFDPAILSGWGVRPSDWNFGVSIAQQVGRKASVDVAYIRRWYQGFFAADNLALQPADLTPFSIVAPLDSRLPGGGGYTVSGLYDVVPAKAGQVNNLVADSSSYGDWSQYFNGLDVTINIRATKGLTLVGGTSTGQSVTDNCDLRANLPELSTTTTGTSVFGAGLLNSAVTPVSPYCHVASGVLTQFRGLASYLIPKVGFQVSATMQSKPGGMLAANYAVPNSAVVPSLGRDLSGNAANVTVNLVEPGTIYGDRVNQLDVRVARIFRYNRTRTMLALDLYNALNSSAVLTYNSTFVPGGTWLQPLAILTPRFFKLTAEIDF